MVNTILSTALPNINEKFRHRNRTSSKSNEFQRRIRILNFFSNKQKEKWRKFLRQIAPNQRWARKQFENTRQRGIDASNFDEKLICKVFFLCVCRSITSWRKKTFEKQKTNFFVICFSRDLQTQGRLPVGPFTISPGGGTVPAGGNALISVECTPESDVPKKFEEVKSRKTNDETFSTFYFSLRKSFWISTIEIQMNFHKVLFTNSKAN